MDFNPLDLLAAAAALQRDDSETPGPCAGKTSSSDSNCDDNTTEESAEEEDPSEVEKMGSARKVVRREIKRQNSCNLPSDIGKLFDSVSERAQDVRTVSEDDLPGRTLRRHSWSSERAGDDADAGVVVARKPGRDGVDSEMRKNIILTEENNSLDTSDVSVASHCLPTKTGDLKKREVTVNVAKMVALEDKASGEEPDDDASGVVSGLPEDEKPSDDENTSMETQTSAIPMCRLCRSPSKRKEVDVDTTASVLCAKCGRQTVAGEDLGPSPSDAASSSTTASSTSGSSTTASGSSVDSVNGEHSESSFIADIPERSEGSEHPGSSSLLESYLTTVGTGQMRYLSSECQVSEEGVDTSDCESRAGSGPASVVESDHSYASQPGKVVERQSTDCYDTENGAESDSCEENSSAEDMEHRARSMSIESACLRCGFEDKHMSLAVKAHDDDVSTEASLLSPTSSIDSSLADFPSVKLAPLPLRESTSQHQSFIQGFSSSDGCEDSPTGSGDNIHGHIPSKIGKFRIGTFASFSSSDINSESATPPNGSKNLLIPVTKDHSSSRRYFDRGLMGSPPMSIPESPGIPSFLQSPCGDWDRSDAGSEVQDEVGLPLLGESHYSEFGFLDNSSVHHDHDYCLRQGHLPRDSRHEPQIGKPEKRKYNKSRIGRSVREPKLKSKVRMKIIKTEPIEPPEPLDSPVSEDPPVVDVTDFKEPFGVDFTPDKMPSVIGRTSRRRLEKLQQVQDQLELDNGSKLKITGKFKDEYVYYLNKASRSRRRSSKELPPFLPSDKILIPAPKPGDIIVPHLTDADIEAIKLRGKAGLSISEKYYGAGLALALHSGKKPAEAEEAQPQGPQAGGSENIADMDSNIISTILSMENDNLGSPSAEPTALSDSVDLYTPAEDSMGINFLGENMSLTPDQVNMLLDAVKDVDSTPEEIIDSSGAAKFNLDDNQNYDQTVDHFEVCSDQKSADEASTSDKAERRQSVSSAASELDTDSKDLSVGGETDDADILESNSEFSSALVPVSETSTTAAVSAQVSPSNDSHAKALLEADLTAIGESNPLPDLIPSLEKPFDLLSNDFRLDKTDLFTDTSVMDNSANTAVTSSSAASAAADYNTPWIVTVTMFWNDLPAIMIDNQPFVRLVDIHKQILPAKDTGILKKRCQLLGIEVKNCAEMQRYFLVQYGRAYNSKSTLIVSQDDAKCLIGYYVTPQPRASRPDDHGRREEALLRHDASAAAGDAHPVKGPPCRKKIRTKAPPKIKVEKTEESVIPATVESPSPDVSPVPEVKVEVKVKAAVKDNPPPVQDKRLRHKKINYLELLKGEINSDSATDSGDGKRTEKEDVSASESSKKGSSISPVRRKARLSDAEKLKLVKEELKKRKIELPEDSGREAKRAHVFEQDSEEENISSPATRRRGTSATRLRNSKSVNGNKKSKLKKVGHLKVKIKGLLNFKKGKKKSAGAVDSKVIEIRHKDPKPTNSHPSVSQDGDIHFDLYQKKNSLCVKCCSCLKFFSLRNFLTHQHYPDDTEVLTTVAQPQMLEPRSLKLSDKKRHLWQEFNKRRRLLEAVKPGSEPKSIVLSKPLNPVNKSVIPTSTSEPTKIVVESVQPQTVPESVVQPVYKPRPELEAELRKQTPQFKQPMTVSVCRRRSSTSDGVRVSSRKRKERQLFPIENYSYAKRVAREDLHVNGDVNTGVLKSVAALALDSVLTLSNGPEITHYTALQDD